MVSIEEVRRLALSFPETDEHPHFHRQAFRVRKKIFATLSPKDKTLNLMLSPIDQSVFCSFDKTIIYPVPGGWGLKGATTVDLQKVKKSMLKDALAVAYCAKAPSTLSAKFLPPHR
jgi:hypothetical protein